MLSYYHCKGISNSYCKNKLNIGIKTLSQRIFFRRDFNRICKREELSLNGAVYISFYFTFNSARFANNNKRKYINK